MSWLKSSVNKANPMFVATETVTLGTTGTSYTSAIDFINLGAGDTKYVTLTGYASLVSGTNLDVSLYGSLDGTTYVQLLDAPIADITTGTTKGASLNIKAYPAPYYKIGFLVDADETGNDVDVAITQAP